MDKRLLWPSEELNVKKRWIITLVGVMLSTATLAKGAIDPFYLGLLEEGKSKLQGQDWIHATETLRIACFGMLEEPEFLVECLVWLSVAERESNEEEAYLKTFGRILRLEGQFSAYSKAPLADSLRQNFQKTALRRVPRAVLDSSPSFSSWIPVPPAQPEETAQGEKPMKVSAERRMLRRRIKKEPENPNLVIRLARLEIENGHEDRGETLLGDLLVVMPSEEGFCLRGSLYVRSKRWKQAADDLERCSAVTEDPSLTMAMVEAKMEVGELAVAEAMAMLLPEDYQSKEKGSALLKRLRLKIHHRSDEVYLTSEETDILGKIRRDLKERLSSEELRKAKAELARVAERHPFDQELQYWVGEVAYRVSDWESAWRYLSRNGGPGIESPERLFYLAVAAHQLGYDESAEEAMRLALPYLSKTAIVETYSERILH